MVKCPEPSLVEPRSRYEGLLPFCDSCKQEVSDDWYEIHDYIVCSDCLRYFRHSMDELEVDI